VTRARHHAPRWIALEGAVNARTVVPGVLLRADNLQSLSDEDVRRLVDERYRGSVAWLSEHGLTPAELSRLRRRLAPARVRDTVRP
jgi:hypothetical protein